MEQLVLSGHDRTNLLSNLAGALVILQRAEKKYAGMTTGGLKRAREMVQACIAEVEPSPIETLHELSEAIAAMPAGPLRQRADKALKSLQGKLNTAERDLMLTFLFAQEQR